MLIFFTLLILWFLFFVYNQVDFTIVKENFLFFYRFGLNNLERANFVLIVFDLLLLISFIVYLILKIKEYKKTTKKTTKKRSTTRKPRKTTKAVKTTE